MPEKQPVVLTIAGFDPSSGAGVTADIKTIAAHGCYGVACITAMTVQSTVGVRRVQALDPELVTDTLQELTSDLDIAAVRIGMLGSGKVAKAVADFLARPGAEKGNDSRMSFWIPSSDRLLAPTCWTQPARKCLWNALYPLCDIVTPNVDEAGVLTGMKVDDLEAMRAAASKLHEMGASAVVITGGHLEKAMDLLSFKTERGVEQEVFKADRQRSNSTHGTGLRLRDGDGVPSGLGTGHCRSDSAGEDLCQRSDRKWTASRKGNRPGEPPLPDESAAPRGGKRGRVRLVVAVVFVGFPLLEQNPGNERCGSGQEPFGAVELDRLPIHEGLSSQKADQQGPRDATKSGYECDQGCGGQADPVLDLVKVQVTEPGWEGRLVPCSRQQLESVHHLLPQIGNGGGIRAGGIGYFDGSPTATGMAEAGAQKELGATTGTGLGHLGDQGG